MVQIQISWFLQKPTDLDLHYLQTGYIQVQQDRVEINFISSSYWICTKFQVMAEAAVYVAAEQTQPITRIEGETCYQRNCHCWYPVDLCCKFSIKHYLISFQHLLERLLNENILFRLTMSYQKPFVFSVSVFCSLIHVFTEKLELRPKVGLTYAISIVK